MTTPPDPVAGTTPDPDPDLRDATRLAPEAVAAAIERKLVASEAAGGDEALDRLALRAALDHRGVSRILESLPLPRIEAVMERWTTRLGAEGPAPPRALRRGGWDVLDAVRRRAVLRRIPEHAVSTWSDRILALVEASHFTVGPLFRQRVETYGSRTLFEIPSTTSHRTLNWRQVAMRVEAVARGLLSLEDGGDPGPVALLSENRLEMALVDLACLTSGVFEVMIPANSTERDVGYMLRHAGVRTVVVSTDQQLRKVLSQKEDCPDLRHVVVMAPRHEPPRRVLTLDEVASRAQRVPQELPWERAEAVRIDDHASVMYTSGTTGTPKGILFSQRNIVFKRFARALALPEIGDTDVFLCYLPLFHTFGRFLEQLGCIFWGAKYCFLENPSVEALVRGMRRYLPTVFISVPKKWIQLYESIEQRADPMESSDAEIADAVREVTGGRLAWGLSAAGHLNSEIFRFFQSQGIELMSGFGMTEATGGITMTRPGRYKDDSLGGALPGIELRLADDGELLIRGPYVMVGYLDPPEGEESLDSDRWFATGDLMETDRDGDIRLVDRKKEIYKNIKGETIAPQRVENLFRDFDSVEMVFLVGDHREYNTALIHPNPNCSTPDLGSMTLEELKAHFRSLVVSVNRFLSPYERIVDFAIIDRNLDPDRGELTAKGTPRRKTVERHFHDVIAKLYRRSTLRVGGLDVLLPNWLFQALGLTSQNLQIEGERLRLPLGDTTLRIARIDDRTARIGSCLYRHRPGSINLGSLLSSPRLWLGNTELVDFVGLDLSTRQRPGRNLEALEWRGAAEPYAVERADRIALKAALDRDSWTLEDIHRAAAMLASEEEADALSAIRLLQRVVVDEDGPRVEPARIVLRRTVAIGAATVRRQAFRVLVPAEPEGRFRATLARFIDGREVLLDDDTSRALCGTTISEPKLSAFIEATDGLLQDAPGDGRRDPEIVALLRFLAAYGASHPSIFHRLRAFLTRAMVLAPRPTLREEARAAREELLRGFRHWLGPISTIAVDPETGQEYGWNDAIVFDDEVEIKDRERLLSAIVDTPMLREAVFVFTGGATVRLSDVPARGIWVRKIGENHGKAVYRITVQTRYQGAHDLAVNVSHDLDRESIDEEIQWLILCGGAWDRPPLVEEFGGYWETQNLWTEEFIPGEPMERSLRRLSRRADRGERLRKLWPFLAWSGLCAYVEFWSRTGGRCEIADPGHTSVVVPTDDYQTGARLVSITLRRPHDGVLVMLRRLREDFLERAENEYPTLAGIAGPGLPFAALLEVVGEHEGLELLREAIDHGEVADDPGFLEAARSYVETTEAGGGFRPLRQHFAIERYRRWAAHNVDATPQARARTVQELYDTYGLRRLVPTYPETRVRFFRDTVFSEAGSDLAEGLEEIISSLRTRAMVGDELIDSISDLRARLHLQADEDYFLARLSFPHLRPEDTASFVDVDSGGRPQSEIVVMLEDRDGNPFRVRHALNPREVGRLHRLFIAANLDVRFRMEHQYLVAINDRGQVIAGIYYEVEEDGANAHLEKIVVADSFRRKGVADALMNELFNRLRAAGIETVTTGFFRPEYFYAYGFRIEKRYAGLVKSLDE